jgi:hypothetical protein
LQRIFGAHAFQVTSGEEVIGKFNGHLQDCVLFIADEAYWGDDKRCVGRLQGMITEPYLPIERKGFDLILVPNYLHVVMLAEPGWVIPAGRYERRYAALSVSDRRREDREYFRALHRQIKEGGAEAMMWDLQRMDLGDWHPREIPRELAQGLSPPAPTSLHASSVGAVVLCIVERWQIAGSAHQQQRAEQESHGPTLPTHSV